MSQIPVFQANKNKALPKCPPDTQCRKCPHYSYDKSIGFKNVEGSKVESGKCSLRGGFTYAEWWGWVNLNRKEDTE